jgi:hypothetical protein
VSWVGPDPVPNWLDVAREYTERWTHQQQARDAVGMPGLREPTFMAPVLATFVHALPQAFAACRRLSERRWRSRLVGRGAGAGC